MRRFSRQVRRQIYMNETLKEKRKKYEKMQETFYKIASEKLAKAKTPEDIFEAYEYVRKGRKRLLKYQRN